MEERIVELETRISYQDHIIQELSDVVAAQQKEIDRLSGEVRAIRSLLQQVRPSRLRTPDEEDPPPHY